jgi:hypothetical protein
MFKIKKPIICTICAVTMGVVAAIMIDTVARSFGADTVTREDVSAIGCVIFILVGGFAFKDATRISDLFNIRK